MKSHENRKNIREWLVILATLLVCWFLLSSCKSRKVINESVRDSVKVVSNKEYSYEKLVDTTTLENGKEIVTTIVYDSTAPSDFEIVKGKDTVTIKGSGKIRQVTQKESLYQKTKKSVFSDSTITRDNIDSTRVQDKKQSKEVVHSEESLKLILTLIGIIVVLLMYIFRKPIFKQIKL